MKTTYRVTSGKYKTKPYKTKKAALSFARFVVSAGASYACVEKKFPHSWEQVQCVKRRKRR